MDIINLIISYTNMPIILVNNIIFLVAVIAILKKLYSITQTAYANNSKTLSSFIALLITVLVVLSTTCLLIASPNTIKWHFGFMVWLIYISAILIIFTIVEALFTFESFMTKSIKVEAALIGFFSYSILFEFYSFFILYDTIPLVQNSFLISSCFNFYPTISKINIFEELRFAFAQTPKLYITSALLQSLSLIVVVKLIRLEK